VQNVRFIVLILLFVCLMVLNAIFNNISVISWQSVLLVEETGGPEENQRPVASHWRFYICLTPDDSIITGYLRNG
jgi:hypothetical protein